MSPENTFHIMLPFENEFIFKFLYDVHVRQDQFLISR